LDVLVNDTAETIAAQKYGRRLRHNADDVCGRAGWAWLSTRSVEIAVIIFHERSIDHW